MHAPAAGNLQRLVHRTVRRVGEDIDALRFNTAVARLMELCNALTQEKSLPRDAVETFVLLLSPFAPHISEELWNRLGHGDTLAYEPWPVFDAELAGEEPRRYAVQVDGRTRCTLDVQEGDDAVEQGRTEPRIAALLQGRTVTREVHVPGRLVNFVLESPF